MSVEIEFNRDGMIAVANQVNATVVRQIAEGVSAEAGGTISVDPRDAWDDFAHTYVTTQFRDEYLHGKLAKALGQAPHWKGQ